MQIYKPKALIEGYKIGQDKDGFYVAVPDRFRFFQIKVIFEDKEKIIKSWSEEAVDFKKFPDKFGRNKEYTLGYFRWK